MRLFLFVFVCVFLGYENVSANLSASSCSLLRSVTSFTNILPELAQLAMRSYSASPPKTRQRPKRQTTDDTGKKFPNTIKGSVIEQMIANTIRDVNFTNVALLMLNNSDNMNRISDTVDGDEIVRIIIRNIDQEKLFTGIWLAIENEFDFEHFVDTIMNRTGIVDLHTELMVNGTLPDLFLKNVHPDLNKELLKKISTTIKNITSKFVQVLGQSDRIDSYLFNMIVQQALTPINNIVEKVKEQKPKTFDQLMNIVVNTANKSILEQISSSKKSGGKGTMSTESKVNMNNPEEVKFMLYQWSIGLNAMGQSARVLLKSLEQLYCASVWE